MPKQEALSQKNFRIPDIELPKRGGACETLKPDTFKTNQAEVFKASQRRAVGPGQALLTSVARLLLHAFSLFCILSFSVPSVKTQTRERVVAKTAAEVIKVEIDLVTIDALVLKKDTARIVGDLKKDDFLILEDGTRQQISHFMATHYRTGSGSDRVVSENTQLRPPQEIMTLLKRRLLEQSLSTRSLPLPVPY